MDGDELPGDLRAAGLRVTRPRLAILYVLQQARVRQEHLAAAEVARLVREQIGSLSTQAVYNALDALTAAGLLRSIEPAGSPARYERRVGDNHHHLVCRNCGRMTDVDCVIGHAPCLFPSDSAGFVVDEAEVVFWGTCPDCTPPARTPTPHSRPRSAVDRRPPASPFPTGAPAPHHKEST